MAAFAKGLFKNFVTNNCNRNNVFLKRQDLAVNSLRKNHMFKHLANNKEHDTEYLYEISRDPKEWEFVEKLMPFETVPVPIQKRCYPSGWRPPTDQALQHPYFVERSKNHMLSVYLVLKLRGQVKITKITKIHGDLWKLHSDLKLHIEETIGKKIASYVHEGNNAIHFKGDYVYYVEQWLLNKGF